MASKPNLGCLFSFLRLLGVGVAQVEAYPYARRDDFLSGAELSFYRVLKLACGERVVVCPKVNVGDVLFVRGGETGAWNRIRSKHFDFVLCEPAGMRPVAAVELDDGSHGRMDRVERDRFLEKACGAAGLRLIRVKAQRGYSVEEIRRVVDGIFGGLGGTEVVGTAVDTAGVPVCGKCGVAMVKRTARRGEKAGRVFYGCVNYPRCREVVDGE
ncbi:MAG: DUF2726 domain-containing protein [Phycisphaerae bacterium]